MSSSPRDAAHLRHGLNLLTTAPLTGFNAYSPMSAVSMASSHIQSAHTPSSAYQRYNPQEWVPSQGSAPDRPLQFVNNEAQGNTVAGAAAPPPPYSPPRSNQRPRPVSIAFEYGNVQNTTPPPGSRFTTLMGGHPQRPPLENHGNRSFPPPPGPSGRGSSRERLFGLASLTRRRDRDQASSSPEPTRPMLISRQSMGSRGIQMQEPETVVSIAGPSQNFVPPASRRAASTGAIDSTNVSHSRSTSQTRWEPGMPVPPPPPGPPPSGSRSQSVQGVDRSSVPIISPPTRRRPPTGVASLGPVPPTPADWVDNDARQGQPAASAASQSPPTPSATPSSTGSLVPSTRSPGLRIDVEAATDPVQQVEAPLGSAGSVGSLSRAKAVRHDKTIIQRRTESRHHHEASGSIDALVQPRNLKDIVVPDNVDRGISTLSASKATPGSSSRMNVESPRTGDSFRHYDSHNSTPRGPDSAKLSIRDIATPPFSPSIAKTMRRASGSQATAPKSLPTPPPQARSVSGSQASIMVTRPLTKEMIVMQTAEDFATGTIERFQAFAMRESAAKTDADRVRLFADFIVSESRIRRERYSSAIGAMGSEIFDLTRDLFRPMVPARRESSVSQGDWTPESSEPNFSHRGSVDSVNRGESQPSSAPTSAKLPPSPSTAGPSTRNNINNNNYMPSLSPILSMSVSDAYENGSSRGRPPSRWWETDSHGEPAERGFERSKRESKYMGLSKDKWVEEEPSFVTLGEPSSSSEYPPEKTGWHDQDDMSWTPHTATQSLASVSTSSPASSRHGLLDVSRLVTLPPPYPRHHPAVNNNHPELTTIRTSVRALSELSEVETTKERFATTSTKRRESFSKAALERRHAMRVNLGKDINSGSLSYADAAGIESEFNDQEKDKKKELEKAEYEHFQNQVVLPLNDILTARINSATELFDDLARHLFDNGHIDADMPQEEGDDKPELLEKLTLLKWIFEQRETLYRAIYDLLTDRNNRYRDVVITPYRLAGNAEKVKSAEAFFAEDSSKREYAYAYEVLNRAREFRSVMEEAVARGIELQLSAFWDIAPPLCRLLESIPHDLEGFGIQIPGLEYEENPAYHDHPLQYLYSLLLHAEKSSYQFIEAHTNQLCLLHEVKEAVVTAKARVLATQVADAEGNPISSKDREEKSQQMREFENQRLTEDLKEKVRVVQDQWKSALGEAMTGVKERCGEWLLQTGGWDEALEDGGVGVA